MFAWDLFGENKVISSLAYRNLSTLGFQPRACCLHLWEQCCCDSWVNVVLLSSLPVGGSEPLRSYWRRYLPRVLLLVYVVDAADHARLPVAKQLLHQLIQSDSTLPVVVLANKQDLEGAYCITDIHDALALSDIGDKRKMFLIGTHVAEDGSEISSSMKDAKELITQLVLETQ
uniref:ADP ribosylation factor like GTPase 9 n=1 Tax=Dromaius novaehollandiae TaxID=8790 RepID=A0A8C4KC82_DRONO